MTTAWPDRHVTFRYLGWSGDTVWAESRGLFDPAQVGYQRMLDLVKELKPTLIILAYGQNESFAGEAGLGKFIAQYEKLCDDLAATGARLAFMTPPKFERPRPPLPDVSRHNPTLAKYVAAVSELAARRKKWKPRKTNYNSGALLKYAQLVGPARDGAVTHPGAKEETHSFVDL